MASTNLSKTPSSAGNRRKFNFSFWIKGNDFVSDYIFFSASGSTESAILFDSSSRLEYYEYNGSSKTTQVTTKKVFRDAGAWYHCVISIDTTQATSSDRVKFYVNGSQETELEHTTYGSQDFDSLFNNTTTQYIGSNASGGHFDGSMTHIHFNDGYTYDASSFGETDSTSGIWKPKTGPSVTYGSNGYFLKFENSGAMGTDSSGNSNTYTVSGSMTQNVDTPNNNFNTLSPVVGANSGVTSSNGNRSFASGSSVNYGLMAPSFALNKGKWYFEYKMGHPCAAGFIADTYQIAERVRQKQAVGHTSEEYAWEGNGYMKTNGGQTAYGSSASANDIIGMYVDLDNNKLYIGVNGTIQNSGTGFSITDPDSLTSGFYYIGGMSDQCGATANVTADMNFGDGFFGTTAVSSAQADANGEGAFEYSPNDSGGSSFDGAAKNFYALNTKNIKEFG